MIKPGAMRLVYLPSGIGEVHAHVFRKELRRSNDHLIRSANSCFLISFIKLMHEYKVHFQPFQLCHDCISPNWGEREILLNSEAVGPDGRRGDAASIYIFNPLSLTLDPSC